MIELIARDMPPAIVMPQEIDRRKRRSRGTRAAIGALIILDDGSAGNPQALAVTREIINGLSDRDRQTIER